MAESKDITIEHRDYLDRVIAVGDSVIFVAPYSKKLQLGRVTKLTNKNVRVAYKYDSGWQKGIEDTTVRPPKDIVKIDGPDLTMFLLKRD